MRRTTLAFAAMVAIGTTAAISTGWAQKAPGAAKPYKVVNVAKVGGDGSWDYVYADAVGRRLYIPRSGPTARISAFDLDTLKSIGEVSGVNARGVAVDPKTHHAFASSNPVVMFDSQTLGPIKTISVEGSPDGLLFDAFNNRVYIFSHRAPYATVINTADGSVVGTIDLGGAPEQAVTDGQGHLYIDIEDKDQVVVVDAKSMAVTARYDLGGKGGGPAGLALDNKNHILFVACHNPATMVVLNARDGKIITALPIGMGVDGATFNPNTMEAFSSQGDGTLTVVKETSPTSFAVEQTVQTPLGARTLTLDTKTNQVFVITAEFAPPPPLTSDAPPLPPGRVRRGPMIPGSFSIVAIGR